MAIACIGHWYTSLLYVVPVVGVGAGLKIVSMRDRDDEDELVDEPEAQLQVR